MMVNRAREDTEEWKKGLRLEENSTIANQPHNKLTKWQSPTSGSLKCNVDGGWRKDGTQSGLGWILRDKKGMVRWLGAKSCPHVRSVIETEAGGLRWAMIMISSFGYSSVIFKTDSRSLVNAVHHPEDMLQLNPIIQDIIHLINLFDEVKIIFNPRECNSVTDRITRETIFHESFAPKLYS
ncbi:unnamed protein product [Arabis nemorensis]|uniref:RNase H type-1 domain-containing protein n=1 Tax=Arabis nemorensis TaxID=586526 RepID=A0A565B8L7_9BRAS|nr:unnamed protein product [Arabis nemorensis]